MKVPVGEWIRSQRGANDTPPRFTQKQLAVACSTDVGNVSRWERGIVVPKAEAFRCLCELFGVAIAEAYEAVEFVAPHAAKKDPRAAVQTAGAESSQSGEHTGTLP